MVVLGGRAVSYERGAPVNRTTRASGFGLGVSEFENLLRPYGLGFRVSGFGFRLHSHTTTSQKCEAAPKRDRIEGS